MPENTEILHYHRDLMYPESFRSVASQEVDYNIPPGMTKCLKPCIVMFSAKLKNSDL